MYDYIMFKNLTPESFIVCGALHKSVRVQESITLKSRKKQNRVATKHSDAKKKINRKYYKHGRDGIVAMKAKLF